MAKMENFAFVFDILFHTERHYTVRDIPVVHSATL